MARSSLTQRSRAVSGDGKFKGMVLGVFVICVLVGTAQAKYSGGTGEPNSPFLIATAADMNAIGADTNDWDKHFLMTADVNLSSFTGTQFNIIGDDSNEFSGVFDGNGHTISNFSYTTTGTNYIGLFGYINHTNAMIKDLDLVDPSVDAGTGQYAGALVGTLVGMLEAGRIKDCRVSGGNVSGRFYVGGLVGFNDHRGVISGCSYNGHVSGSNPIGGLVGFNNNDGKILMSRSAVNVSGNLESGGLVGINEGRVENCYSSGQTHSNDRAGGLIGSNNWTVKNCYSTVEVSGGGYVGAFLGADFSGTYTKCFWDSDVNPDVNGIGNKTDPNVIGKTTTQMQTKATFTSAGWDFLSESTNGANDVWRMCVDDVNYPLLSWQFNIADFVCLDGVDEYDLEVIAEQWLKEGFSAEVDFYSDEKIDFLDWDVFAAAWGSNSLSANWNPACDVAPVSGDGVIDGGDMAVFLHHWLQNSSYQPKADIAPAGGDGIVNNKDFEILAENWLKGM